MQKMKVMVAPLLRRAGIKGKVIEPMANLIPVVTTEVGPEGFPLVSGLNGFVANMLSTSAATVYDVYKDEKR